LDIPQRVDCSGCAARYHGHVLGNIRAHILVIVSLRVVAGPNKHDHFRPSWPPSGNSNRLVRIKLIELKPQMVVSLIVHRPSYLTNASTARIRSIPDVVGRRQAGAQSASSKVTLMLKTSCGRSNRTSIRGSTPISTSFGWNTNSTGPPRMNP